MEPEAIEEINVERFELSQSDLRELELMVNAQFANGENAYHLSFDDEAKKLSIKGPLGRQAGTFVLEAIKECFKYNYPSTW